MEINPAFSFFRCRLKMYVNWEVVDAREPGAESQVSLSRAEITEYIDHSNKAPLVLLSTLEINVRTPSLQIGHADGISYGLHSYELDVTVFEVIELNDFPFDHQHLHMMFSLEGSTKEKFDMYLHQVDIRTDMVAKLAEWKMHPPTCNRKSGSEVELSLVITRLYSFYIQNVVGMSGALAALSLLAFTTPISDISGRLEHVAAMLLTVVANKFATMSELPNVPYNTCVDGFFNLMFLYMVMVCIAVAVPGIICYQKDIEGGEDSPHEHCTDYGEKEDLLMLQVTASIGEWAPSE
jgi:hypothetical protein